MTEQMNLVDPDPVTLKFECLKARQPIGDVFLASIPYDQLVKITYFDVRRVLQDDRDVERYLGIQRPLIRSRVDGLQKYVNFFDASFPTAIIIAVEERFADYDEKTKTISLSNVPRDESQPEIPIRNIARVLDGQHRIAGLRGFEGDEFDVPVTIFVGADIADQAHIFATVNLEQQKVNKSLTYDLYSLAKSRSPQKTCHNVAVVLDQDKNSPFYMRIKRLGVSTDGRKFEPISQATFVEALMAFVSAEPKVDRDKLLKGELLEKAAADEIWKRPFRNMFVEERDLKIVEVVFNYFSAVKERWPIAWANNDKGNMLNRTNGFRAFMRAYQHVHKLHRTPTGVVPKPFMDEFMKKVPLEDRDFNTDNFKPGSAGEAALLSVLRDVQ
ncbi:DGQHR domain-containing protein [Sulfitobacter sp. 20_GPM-1509m]|uniref:DGQHR domain-containing protein n=1 Tax=Sulfitobacter sp. 20_GPM-1509m TaxID=1380367 RepID=UPI000AB1003C|nr:DGQHR domain-containing protein [Sulfitobacter sp. 20_GPM-1509m]